MKMLYIVDREALGRWERPVIGGCYCSMKHGTIISQVLTLMRLIEGVDEPSVWTEHLTKVGNEMHLIDGGDATLLAPAETMLVDEVFEKFGWMDKWQLCEYTHSFEEWEDAGDSSKPIRVENVLSAVGKSDEEIARVSEEVDHLNQVDSLIGA